jgi:hypothetical protein
MLSGFTKLVNQYLTSNKKRNKTRGTDGHGLSAFGVFAYLPILPHLIWFYYFFLTSKPNKPVPNRRMEAGIGTGFVSGITPPVTISVP